VPVPFFPISKENGGNSEKRREAMAEKRRGLMSRTLWLLSAAALALWCPGPLHAADTEQPQVIAMSVAADEAPPAPGAPWLGIEVFTVSPALQSQLGLADREGLVVEALTPGGPADRGGLKLYDVLVKAGGKRVEAIADLQRAMVEAKDGKLALDLIRGGRRQSISVGLGKRPPGWRSEPPIPADPAALARLLERMYHEGSEGPVQLRFFRPGVILPPGAPLYLNLKLPANTSVSVTREGDKPAKIVVQRGEQKWEVSEDEINKLPEDLRGVVEQMVGRGKVWIGRPGGPQPGAEAPETRRGDVLYSAVPGGESRLEKRLDELTRQVDQLRKAIEDVQRVRPGDELSRQVEQLRRAIEQLDRARAREAQPGGPRGGPPPGPEGGPAPPPGGPGSI
jgi:hypothetical protein